MCSYLFFYTLYFILEENVFVTVDIQKLRKLKQQPQTHLSNNVTNANRILHVSTCHIGSKTQINLLCISISFEDNVS